uniref:MIP06894p n=1 Tax=Drosophila melanogaster TaxID=7227 RepID=C8VV78_DROME|nr:MIP06894p [Drosophila melanogaster]
MEYAPSLITHRPLERGLNPTAAASVSVLRGTCRWILWALICVFACVCVFL